MKFKSLREEKRKEQAAEDRRAELYREYTVRSMINQRSKPHILFEYRSKKDERRDRNVRRAGLVAAGVGALALPAALPMLKIQGRSFIGRRDPTAGGKFVADYVTASQRALNSGPQGYLAGKIIQRKRANAAPGLDKFMADHYARFRSSPTQALGHWDYEAGASVYKSISQPKGVRRAASPEQVGLRMGEFNKRREKVQSAITDRLNNHGRNEIEALRDVAQNADPDIQKHFRLLAAHKKDAVKKFYAPLSLASPALIGVGAGIYAAGDKKRKKGEKRLSVRGSRTTYLDATQGDWDLRDARGRSARVYAPGAGKRDRREKKWYERASFLRKAALAGALLGVGGVAWGTHKTIKHSTNKTVQKAATAVGYRFPQSDLTKDALKNLPKV